jgi:hypothetical protein
MYAFLVLGPEIGKTYTLQVPEWPNGIYSGPETNFREAKCPLNTYNLLATVSEESHMPPRTLPEWPINERVVA